MAGEAPAVAAAGEAPPAAGTVYGRESLRTRIALWTGAVNLALLVLLTLVAVGFARRVVLQDARNEVRASALEVARRLDNVLGMVSVTAIGIADTVGRSGLEQDELTAMMRATVAATPGATGGLLAVEPAHPGDPDYARYIAIDGRDRDFIAAAFPLRSQAWYRRTLASQRGWWSEPYFNDTAGGVWMTTFNLPVRGTAGEARGMVSIDMPIDTLAAQVETLASLPGWQLGLTSPEGLLTEHPEAGVALHYTLPDYIRTLGRTDLARAAEAVRLRQPLAYLHTDPRNGVEWFTAIEPVGDSGWTVSVSESYSQILGVLYQVLVLVLAGGVVIALLSTLAVRRLANRISSPVEDLAGSASHLDNGEYDWPVPHRERHDEVGHLARTLDGARTSIQRQLVEIRELGAAEQKRESELSMARDIQQSMVPPPRRYACADGIGVDVHAVLEPATAVGGDFYGYHESDGVFWFGIGDVSDKGLPAALFMARSDAILKTASRSTTTPAGVLVIASRDLAEGNDACMFVTTLIGRIDLRNGDCMLASAGHDTPLLLHADGGVERLDFECGPPLGFEVSNDFPLWRGRLEPGDGLVAWTDGITEAFNAANEAFGEERLLAAVRAGYSARENCERLVAQVHAFAAGAPQSDDITVLAIRAQRGEATAE